MSTFIYPGVQLQFWVGDFVREHDGRHIGEVKAAWNGIVRVVWLDSKTPICPNGIKQDFQIEELVLVARRRAAAAVSLGKVNTRPRTVVESPKAKLERYFAKQRERNQAQHL